MFTGIVEELGTVAGDRGPGRRRPAHRPRRARARRRRRWATRSPSTAAASPSPSATATTWTADVMQETLDKTSLAGVQPGDRVNLERAVTADDPARRPHRAGPRRRRRHDPSPHAQRALGGRRDRACRPSWAATWSTRARSPSTASASPSSRPRDDGFTVSLIPETLARTTLGSRSPATGSTSRSTSSPSTSRSCSRPAPEGAVMTEPQHVGVRMDSVERAIADIAAGKAVVVVDDEDRENEGDIIFAASKATPELMAFTIRYSSGVICVPMPGDDARPARDPADDAAQQGQAADGVHDLGRRPRRRHHRHLGGRPRAHRAGAGRLGDRAVGDHPARATSSRCATARAACWPAAATPRPRSTWPGWPGSPRPACWSRSSTTTAP